MTREMKIFSGSANRQLAQDICELLQRPLGEAEVSTFKNGETRVRIEEHVRGRDVFVVQPTSAPADHHIIELSLMIDALKRASAGRITAVMPYYGYAKQEKKTTGREPISAKLVANFITVAGADRVLAIDLHAPAIQGFFDIPVDNLTAMPLLADHLHEQNFADVVVVSPDTGGVARANDFRTRIGASLAIISKHRPEPDQAKVLDMVGEVEGKVAVIVDDIISTGGTLHEAAELLYQRGATEIYVYATHAALADEAPNVLRESRLTRVTVTDTIPVPQAMRDSKIGVLSVAGLLANAISRIHQDSSVSALFKQPRFRQAELIPS
ncbi:MAG TPA: ribose-phosphate pyrophosphokinase [Chloroflexota bacterium]|nr:ribose-phosphate pyrophosphokinase [Chloroflexota bacterium]